MPIAAVSGGVGHLDNDRSGGWSSGMWGLVAVLVIAALIAVLVISVRRSSSSEDEE